MPQAKWDAAHARRRDRRKLHARGSTSTYAFSGLLDCLECDHRFHGHTTTKGKPRKDGTKVRTSYYICSGYDLKGTAICPVRWSVRETDLWQATIAAIADEFQWLLCDDRVLNAIVERAVEIMGRPAAVGGNDSAEQLERRMREVEAKANLLVTEISAANLKLIEPTLTALRKKHDRFQSQLNALQDSTANIVSDQQALDLAVRGLREAYVKLGDASRELQRRFIRHFLERIELDPKKKTGTAYFRRLPRTVLDSLRPPFRSIAGAGLEPATSGL